MTAEATQPWWRAWTWNGKNRVLMAGVWWNALLLLASLGALPFDRRRIFGLNPWIKPMKFEISLIVYLLTLALLFPLLDESGLWRRPLMRMRWGIGIAAIVEISLIALQSARGVPSHMNYTSALNGVIFAVMGVFIALNTALLMVGYAAMFTAVRMKLLWLVCVARLRRPAAEVWGIRLGLAMLLLGSLEGVWLVFHGAHTVGAADGGAGLPFLNWSTGHGDLRVAHFFALHALQLLWGTGWLLGRSHLPARVATVAMMAGALVYAGGVWLLFAQAMAGRAVIALRWVEVSRVAVRWSGTSGSRCRPHAVLQRAQSVRSSIPDLWASRCYA